MSRQEQEQGLAAQARLLADGRADRQDYEAAVVALEQCLADHDIALVNHGWNPVDHRQMMLWYRNVDMPAENVAAAGDQCHEAHLGEIESRYGQNVHPVMAEDLMAFSRDCMSGHHIPTTGAESALRDLIRAAGPERTQLVVDCVHTGAEKLYSEAPVAVTW